VSADEFLQALLGDDASLKPLIHLLITRTEGNPFFLEESVRTLVETGVLVGERGAYRLGQALPTIQVPAMVQAVLAARIDRLPPEVKRLLQTAAVIGTEVLLPLLQAIAEMSEEVLHHSLTHLQAAEFLYETRFFPEREFTFKHALPHEVAYGSLLQERRRVLHARIVEALEMLEAERLTEHVERLAHHAWRGEVWDKVVTYARHAGAKASARSAHGESVTHFEQALAALDHLPASRETTAHAIDLRLDLYAPFLALRDYPRIGALLHQASALAAVGGNMQEEQIEEKSLHMLIGEQLSAVTFVQDYLQLHFDGPRLTVFSHTVVRLGDQIVHGGKPGFRDASCNNIANKVVEARVAYGDTISIRFADGAMLKISLKDEDYPGGEAVNFDAGGNVWWSL
jgi:hypothetical protein